MEDAHSAIIGIPDQKESGTYSSNTVQLCQHQGPFYIICRYSFGIPLDNKHSPPLPEKIPKTPPRLNIKP